MGGVGRMPLPIGIGGGGVVGLVVLLLYLFLGGGGGGFGVDPGVDGLPQAPAAQGQTTSVPADEPAQFVAAVVADVQQTWKQIFERAGRTYESTRLVLFDAPTQTGCGVGSPATGPFYCPPPTIGSTSTSASSASCRNGSARRATSRRRT